MGDNQTGYDVQLPEVTYGFIGRRLQFQLPFNTEPAPFRNRDNGISHGSTVTSKDPVVIKVGHL